MSPPASVRSSEPRAVIAGETLSFRRCLSAYPPASWTLTYYLTGQKPYSFSAIADGGDHLVEVAAATTATWFPGRYTLSARLTNGSQAVTLSTAAVFVEVLPNPATRLQSLADPRSFAAQTLEVVEAAIKGLAAKQISSASVNGQSYAFTDLSKLMQLRDRMKEEIRNEKSEQQINAGMGGGRKILTRFVNPQ